MGSLPGNKVTMDTPQSSGSDTEITDDRIPDPATSKVEKNTSHTTTIKGSENSTVTRSTIIGAADNCTFNLGENQREGLSCNITEGAKPKLKISVPAEDGGKWIYVQCTNGKVRQWSFRLDVDIEKTFVSRWIFENIFNDFMAAIINGKIGDSFFDLIGKLEDLFGCKLHRFYKECLVIEFLHETEEGRSKMIKEQDKVRQMFQDFMESVKPDAPDCTLKVTEIETPTSGGKPDTASKDAGQDVGLPSTSSREEDSSPEIEDEQMSNDECEHISPETGTCRLQDDTADQDATFFISSTAKSSSKKVQSPDEEGKWRSRSLAGMIQEVAQEAIDRRLAQEAIDRRLAQEAIDRRFLLLVPSSLVEMLKCESCLDVLRDCEEDLSTFENVFFFHLNHHRISTYEKAVKFSFLTILTAFRSYNGGVLIVHGFNTSMSCDFHTFIKSIFGSILNEDVVQCEVFKTQNIKKYKYMFRIDVKPSDKFVTLDYKTKFPSSSMDKFENASNEKVRHLLFSSRTAESTEAALRGVSSKQQNLEPLRLYSDKRYAARPLEYDILHSLVSDMTALCVPEHVSALSKKPSGGNIYVVMSKLKFDAIPPDLQKRIKDHLRQELMNKLRCQENKHSKVSLQGFGVIDITLSKDAETEACSIEIAVGHVNGCVFYDPKGPVSYKIEGYRPIRLPFEKWIEEAFE